MKLFGSYYKLKTDITILLDGHTLVLRTGCAIFSIAHDLNLNIHNCLIINCGVLSHTLLMLNLADGHITKLGNLTYGNDELELAGVLTEVLNPKLFHNNSIGTTERAIRIPTTQDEQTN